MDTIKAPDTGLGPLAVTLLERFRQHPTLLVYVAASSERAESLAALLAALDPTWACALLPPWDCLPYDHVLPSRRAMGLRAGTFRWLTDTDNRPDILVTSARAVLQRTAPPEVWAHARLELRADDAISLDDLSAALVALGYERDENADDPGSFSVAGQVVDIYPAAAPRPCRVEINEGRIVQIRSFDSVSRRSLVEADVLVVDPASESIVTGPDEQRSEATRSDRLLAGYEHTASLFDYVPDLTLVLEAQAEVDISSFFDLLAESYEDECAFSTVPPAPPEHTYLSQKEWHRLADTCCVARVETDERDTKDSRLPPLRPTGPGGSRRPFASYVRQRLTSGAVVLATADAARLRRMLRQLPSDARHIEPIESWHEACALKPGQLASLDLPIANGFQLDELAVIAPDDVFTASSSSESNDGARLSASEELAIGEPAIHLDQGLGIVEGLDAVGQGAEHLDTSVLRMEFADAKLLVPRTELWKVWPFDGEIGSRSLDRLKQSSWEERRQTIVEEIARASQELMQGAGETRAAPKLTPDWKRYDRFVSRFPFHLTVDQRRAIDDVVRDLQSDTRMDRLLCGDVGFGKTEVALHAIALTAFAGKQAALLAPTTILARQHFATLQRRFRGMGLKIDQLSRLTSPAEAREIKKRVSTGVTTIVVGTHALLSTTVHFSDLALIVVDEEQRFGAAQKAKLQVLAQSAHRLTMTATPIPRTLQMAQVGLRRLSLVATPPQSRLPVRTLSMNYDEQMLAAALQREKARGGQSFVVCPRIEDLAPMAERLAPLCPGLRIETIHGRLPAAEIDDTLMRFAEGSGDILLATAIIESGLDIPNANTMVVWRPDRFGLAQLHQLRGRVGRGTRRGALYLVSPDEDQAGEEAERRLHALQDLSHLGAGFDISLKDLAQRGAGDLFGDEQSGHLNVLGSALYAHLWRRASAQAAGEQVTEEWHADIMLGLPFIIPDTYMPEENVRLSVYRRLVMLQDLEDVDAMALELEDRFGALPTELHGLILEAKLRVLCRIHRIVKVIVGPAAVALTCADSSTSDVLQALGPLGAEGVEDRVVIRRATEDAQARTELLQEVVDALL